MRSGLSLYRLSCLFWVTLMAVALYARPHLPVDETRYLAVAWEMWFRGDFLVPYLNGETYSHKPPLLFWLMHAGWGLFGVNEWWPRLIAPLFGLGCLVLVRQLARLLWPNDLKTAEFAPLILVGCAFWALFVTLTMFDMMLAFFGLLGLLGVVRVHRGDGAAGYVYLALAVGLGILTKGPAILLHILPVAVTAPLWSKRFPVTSSTDCRTPDYWYLKLLLATVIGIGLALVWAVPAGIAGGDAYQQQIFWGQAAGRMVKSFAHQRPFWWFAVLMPVLLLPWFIWPSLWKAARAYGAQLWNDGASLLCLIWFATAFVAFSLISGKQLHYLLPEFPAIALLFARSLSTSDTDLEIKRIHLVLPALLFGICGLIICLAQFGRLPGRLPVWLPEVQGYWGAALVGIAVWTVFSPDRTTQSVMIKLASLPFCFVVVLHLALSPVLHARYNMEPLAIQLKSWEDAGIPVAFFGKYHGQYQFLGRLTRALPVLGHKNNDVALYLQKHPNSRIITYYKKQPEKGTPVVVYPFRQGVTVVWDGATLIANPGLENRP